VEAMDTCRPLSPPIQKTARHSGSTRSERACVVFREDAESLEGRHLPPCRYRAVPEQSGTGGLLLSDAPMIRRPLGCVEGGVENLRRRVS